MLVGRLLGENLGNCFFDGRLDGKAVGYLATVNVGAWVGNDDGFDEGVLVGSLVGVEEGVNVGFDDG